jgi:hypothetical protein
MQNRRCAACGQLFRPRPQVPQQCYCAEAACQRERRRRWQQAKRVSDGDYRDNDARGQRAWREAHPDYWRQYRQEHPQYTDRNRVQQHGRNARRGVRVIANEDVSTRDLSLTSGTYRLIPAGAEAIANGDAWTVEIAVLSKA